MSAISIFDLTESDLLQTFGNSSENEQPHHFNSDYWNSSKETNTDNMAKKNQHRDPPATVVPMVTPSKSVALTSIDQENQNNESGIPNKFDILCGQSRICASHTGNVRFQVVLDIYAERYDSVTAKQEKMQITKEIVACIHQAGGRFLKYVDGEWIEISDVLARDKVSHALRTKVASWKRQKQEREQQNKQKEEETSSSKAIPKKKTHHRKPSDKRRRSSTSILTSSFDATDSTTKNAVMEDLLKAQREIFASLTEEDESMNMIHPLKL